MTDYLIDEYNAEIKAAREEFEASSDAAARLYHDAYAELFGRYQGRTSAAAIRLETAMEHRDRVYLQGSPVVAEEPAPQAPTQPADGNVVTLQQPEPGDERGVSQPMQTAAE